MAEVLLVEDTPALAEIYAEALRRAGHKVSVCETGHAAVQILDVKKPDLVLLDLHLPDMNGIEILRRLKRDPAPPLVIVVTAYSSVNVAVEAMREGAYDFLAKPFQVERLIVTVRNALDARQLSRVVARLTDSETRGHYHGFIGSSPIMQSLYRIIQHLAASKATVFITGESGTGKEVCAEAIHATSARADKPFVALNCAAIPRELMESEIFGHVKGSFTGALTDRPGAAQEADGGTLFLDEVCEMEPGLQTKLLRFLQTGTVRAVGASKAQKVDLRIIAATNRDPLAEVEAGRFREDLYYRLHVVPLALPRLAERGEDILEIARAMLDRYTAEEGKAFRAFDPDAEHILLTYSWPGNVRQLQNVIRNIVALQDGETVTPAMLPPPLAGAGNLLEALAQTQPSLEFIKGEMARTGLLQKTPAAVKPLWLIERGAIEEAVTYCDGNVPRAAALLEVSPSTIYRKRMSWSSGALA
jgi:DNA-binding NtrC family response regulator